MLCKLIANKEGNLGSISLILLTAFVSVCLHHSYWRIRQGVQQRSRAYFLVGRNGEVGHNFVGETERHLLAQKNYYPCICALRQKVDEIDPQRQFHSHFTRRFYTNPQMRKMYKPKILAEKSCMYNFYAKKLLMR